MASMSEELPLSIPVKAVSEHFTCPICIEMLSQTHITHCGHRYCGKCIKECINRRSKCPCCNTRVTMAQLFPDWAFDNLISMVSSAKDKAEDAYFVQMIQEAGRLEQDGLRKDGAEESPIVGILQKHLKKGLASHELYYRELQEDFSQRVGSVEAQMEGLKGGDDASMAQGLQELEQQKQALETELRTCTRLLVEAYDKYLIDNMPTPSLLPVSISVRLHGKGITLPDIKLKPHSSVSDIKDAVVTAMKARSDPVRKFNDEEVHYFLLGPFDKGREISAEHLDERLSPGDSNGPDDGAVRLIPRDCHPVLEFGMKPGSEVVLFGTITLESEMPKQCFAQTFVKDRGQSMDYFTCKDCSFKWVCKSCRDFCHKGHETHPYILGHQPTWACCYCPRKKKCQLREVTA